MPSMEEHIAEFQDAQRRRAAHARQMAALQIACGIDLEHALTSTSEERQRIISRLERKLRRERQRGLARHWAYSLDRHIALKQVLDRLAGGHCESEEGGRQAAFGSRVSGAE